MDHSKLIHRMLVGDLSSEDKKLLNELRSDPSFIEQYDSFKAIWIASREYFPQQSWGKEAAKAEFLAKINSSSPIIKPTPNTSSNIRNWVIGICALIALAFLVFVIKNISDTETIKAIDSTEYALLEDKTEVWVGPNSAVAVNFDEKDIRKVELSGDAVFHVAKNASRPFVVSFGDMSVEVLGTAFKIDEDSDGISTLEVRSGKVKLYESKNPSNFKILISGEVASIDHMRKSVNMSIASGISPLQGIAGKSYKNVALTDVFEDIERAYGVKVRYNREQIKNCRFTSLNVKDVFLDDFFNTVKATFPTMSISSVAENAYKVDGLTCS